VASLELLAAAAGTGIVAANLGHLAPDGDFRQLDLGFRPRLRGGRRQTAGRDRRGDLHAGRCAGRRCRTRRGRSDRLRTAAENREHVLERAQIRGTAEKAGADLQPDVLHQLLEILVGLALVFNQRILLAVAAQADRPPQFLHLRQMLLPMVIDRIDHDVALNRAKRLRNLHRLLHRVGRADLVDHGFREGLKLPAGQILDLEADRERRVGPAKEAFHGGLGRPGLLAHARVLQAGRDLFLDLLENDVLGPVRMNRAVADAIDDFPLLVEDVVILQQALPLGVVLLLDLLLRALD